MAAGSLGILVCEKDRNPPFGDERFHRQLCISGQNLGLEVVVFSPGWIKEKTRNVKIYGYTYNVKTKQWEIKTSLLPLIIYDRCFYKTRQDIEDKKIFLRLLETGSTEFLGLGLKDKWEVYRYLLRHVSIQPFLPETERLRSYNVLQAFLRQHKEVFIKPVSGSQGKGVLHIIKSKSKIMAAGRDEQNRRIDAAFKSTFLCYIWLQVFMGAKKYIIQPALKLKTQEQQPFDMRVLVQKNKDGNWQLTGSAIRLGEAGGETANLHGGGKAIDSEAFLKSRYGEAKQFAISRTVEWITYKTAELLEKRTGRLAELGIDFGIDENGRIWLLEVNSKPGRSVFNQHPDVKKSAIEQPLHFAKHLLDQYEEDEKKL